MSPQHCILPLALSLLLVDSARADTLLGQIVDANGFGIAGVKLDVQDLAGLDPVVENGVTDALGNFEATLPAGLYRIVFEPPVPPLSTHLPGEIESLLVSGAVSVGTIALEPGVSVSGRLVDASFVPVANVDLDVRNEATGEEILLLNDNSDPFGLFTIVVPIGSIGLQIDPSPVLPGFGVFAPQELALSTPFNLDLGDVILQPGFTASGVLLDPSGLPVPNADFDFEDSLTGAEIYTPGDNTDAFGFFSIIVSEGLFDIQICPPEGTLLVSRRFHDVPVNDTVNAGLVGLDFGVLLSGTVVDCVGGPVAGVDLDVRNDATGIGVPLCGDNTDEFGFYSVVVPTGVYDLIFTSFDLGTGALNNNVSVFGNTLSNANLPCCPPGEVAVRNGSGVNPLAFSASNSPSLGGTLQLEIDASGHSPGVVIVVARYGALSGVQTGAGELLIDPTAQAAFTLMAGHTAGVTALSGSVPLDPLLCGKSIHAQALIFGDPGAQYTNALELTAGG